jgi:amidase
LAREYSLIVIHEMTAVEQAQAIQQGEFTAVEATEHYLRRIEAHNDTIAAYVHIPAERALDQAAKADRDLRIGGPSSALHGVVVPIKDLNLVTGVPTTFGSVALHVTPPISDFFVDRLERSGTITLGKTATPEFGLTCYTEPDGRPPSRNPWDLERSPGGSSGGAAAAVAAGLAPVAQGSDGGGSIRIPASSCGLVGIKPTRGRVSNGPLADSLGELAVNGPLARTVADAAALLHVMSGNEPGDHFLAPNDTDQFLTAVLQEPRPLRIGRFSDPVIAQTHVDSQVQSIYEETSVTLRELGHTVDDIRLDVPHGLVEHFETLWSALAASIPLTPEHESGLRPITTWLRDRGKSLSAVQLTGAVSATRSATRSILQQFAPFDVILTPTLAALPAPIGALRNDADPPADFAAQKAFTPFTALVNMTGQPAISVPIGWTPEGLPVGMQLIGRPYDEFTLIQLAAQLEAALPWRHRYAEMWRQVSSNSLG